MSDKISLEEDAYEALEKDFHQVVLELMGDKSLQRFRVEYEKLHKALKKAHESEKRLMSKCRDLNAEIVSNSLKVSQALKLSQDDQATIQQLKLELEKSWKMSDSATERESLARETISTLKLEIANLSRLVRQGAGVTTGIGFNISELVKVKEELTTERDELLSEVSILRDKLADSLTEQGKHERKQEDAEKIIAELQQDIQMKQNEIRREIKKKGRVEESLTNEKTNVEEKELEIHLLQAQLQQIREDNAKMESQLKDNRMLYEKAGKDVQFLNVRFTKLQQDYQIQIDAADQLSIDNQSKAVDLKALEEVLNVMRQDTVRLTKMHETICKRVQTVEDSKVEVEGEKEALRVQISGMEREVEAMKKQAGVDKKVGDELVRERDLLNKSCHKAEMATKKQADLVKLHEQSKNHLEHEIQNYKNEAQKQRKLIHQLEKDRDRFISDAAELTQKALQNLEDIKVKEMLIFDFKKKFAESETKLKQQQNLYEAVRADRNLYSKNLLEAHDQISEMKRKLRVMHHQIDQLKEEITTKESALVKVNLEHARAEKEKEASKVELQRMKQDMMEGRANLEQMEKEVIKLQQVIREADVERKRYSKELDQVIGERDVLGTQLVRRNDELSLLYEKIKIQQSTLNKGEIQYRHRLDDIRILKLDIKKLRREKAFLKKGVTNAEELKSELYLTQKDLIQERTRCKALQEELENPINIHRWRRLEGTDPSAYEMIQKIQALQKRLIQKTSEVVDKEMMIQEKDNLYIELKRILARQPGPEVAEQIRLYEETLRSKTKQMKRLASELNMHESQTSEHKFEIQKLAEELKGIKKKYFVQKKKERSNREREKALAKVEAPQKKEGTPVAGGGFKFVTPKKDTKTTA